MSSTSLRKIQFAFAAILVAVSGSVTYTPDMLTMTTTVSHLAAPTIPSDPIEVGKEAPLAYSGNDGGCVPNPVPDKGHPRPSLQIQGILS
jgi:hypothetical protein